MEDTKKYKIITIPNILSMLRLILVVVFAFLYDNDNSLSENISALLVLMISGITDFLDGRIARRYNMVSEVGKILDPIADKVTEAVIAVCLWEKYALMKLMFGILVIKEFIMCLSGAIVLKVTKINNGAKWFGKVSTFVFYIVTICLLLMPKINNICSSVMIMICIFLMIFSLIMYEITYVKMLKKFYKNIEKE